MDPEEATKYSVIVGVDPNTPFGQLLAHLGAKIANADGTSLTHFWCSHVDASHPIYLEIVSHKPPTAAGIRLRIPHHLVAMIADPEIAKNSIGFLPS